MDERFGNSGFAGASGDSGDAGNPGNAGNPGRPEPEVIGWPSIMVGTGPQSFNGAAVFGS